MNTIIQTSTNDLTKSVEFYEKLKFHSISPDSRSIFTDSKVLIEINSDRYARIGIKFIDNSWDSFINIVKKSKPIIKTEKGFLLQDNNGINIFLEEDKSNKVILQDDISTSILGNFAGLSIETLSIKESINFYQLLGFKIVAGEENSSWVTMANKDLTISFMLVNICPHLFFNPSLTFFNGNNNLAIINRIRELKINFAEEITYFNNEGIVDNVIIKDPGGLGFFIFND